MRGINETLGTIELLLDKISAHQANVLYHFLLLSEYGDKYIKLSADGGDWVSIEWIGWTDTDSATHCRIQADSELICDFVFTVEDVYKFIEAMSEINAFVEKFSEPLSVGSGHVSA